MSVAPSEQATGREPWVSDGTVAGTRRILDLTPGPAPSIVIPTGVIGGIFGGLALLSFVYGTQRYDLAIVGVTGSLFPAVSAFLLWRFLDHPLRWWQGVGIAGVLLGTSLVAVG